MKIKVAEEVKKALAEGKAVVALESTIISHGMPYPQNVETALRVEEEVRKNGAVPATIAIIDGVPTVGCNREEIEKLGKAGLTVTKVSRRDIPIVIAKGLNGATTVASTMILAEKAGVKIFATGGIGGVHRGAEKTMDISADLDELSKTNVTVVCAGAKSILDLNLTMEYLETKGVAVIGYGTDELPAFFTRESGIKVGYRMDTPKEIAESMKAKEDMGLEGGMLVTNPIPEEYSMDAKVIGEAIDKAVKEAEDLGVKGKDITPFLLDKIQKITGGDSLASNIQLVLNNARLASQIAVELSKLG
ncbi:MAG: pseudouridine-5'-phosphate glycosidase [Clostridia bacterium]|nr:pseudouridine-5'-phosphate glycosidase [Clostridia bacterium]MBR2919371.1 pseudouridine-5'-phosphate glycosidase [Clostridia bacterium]